MQVNSVGSQSIFAGSSCGFSGDGGGATTAQFNAPQGMAVCETGDVFIADTNNNRIRKVVKFQILEILFDQPNFNEQVNSAAVVTTFAGTGQPAFTGDGASATSLALYNPISVVVSSLGDVFIADVYNYRIRKVRNLIFSSSEYTGGLLNLNGWSG